MLKQLPAGQHTRPCQDGVWHSFSVHAPALGLARLEQNSPGGHGRRLGRPRGGWVRVPGGCCSARLSRASGSSALPTSAHRRCHGRLERERRTRRRSTSLQGSVQADLRRRPARCSPNHLPQRRLRLESPARLPTLAAKSSDQLGAHAEHRRVQIVLVIAHGLRSGLLDLSSRLVRPNQLYGTIGFVIGLIFWIYLGACGSLLATKLNIDLPRPSV